MKIVFSRKGFDSQYGGVPNAILPDGTLFPFPIEDRKSIVRADEVRRGGESAGELVEQLTRRRIIRNYRAHLDPDLEASAYPREPDWRPVLGQTGSSLGHLRNQGVDAGDLFLFFGWFRSVKREADRWAYSDVIAPAHMIWGWLHVRESLSHTGSAARAAPWLGYHPHMQRSPRNRHVLYVASDALDVGGRRVAGGGIFPRFSQARVLTAEGENVSVWRLPGWTHPESGHVRFSYIHDRTRWRWSDDGCSLVRTIGKGQEIVMSASQGAPIEAWLATIFGDVPSLTRS